jgi:hypothetical protein
VKAKVTRAALERGGRIYARGTLDAQGGLAMRAVRRVRHGAAVSERDPVTIR